MLEPISLLVIVALIFGLVEFVKACGLTGNILRVVSMGIGMLLFGAFQAREMYPVAQPYIDLVLYMIGGGLSACGYYDFLKTNVFKKLPLQG